jgi:hypothetical protein
MSLPRWVLQRSPKEDWRPIPGLPDYEASTLGRIRSQRTGRWQIMFGTITGSGYRYVCIRQGGAKKNRTVHSLVAEAFHGPRPDGLEVRHLDGNHLNNAPTNLTYGTPSQNRYDSVAHGTHRWARRHGAAS